MKFFQIFFFLFLVVACQQPTNTTPTSSDPAQNEQTFKEALTIHLDAINARDLATLEATLSPKGSMHLILPQSKTTTTAKEFMDYHRVWFEIPDWTLDSKILHTDVVEDMGIAIVEALYKETERDGKPYFNRMQVSYAMKKIDGRWYVIKDHASSIEKSTDGE